ncbi:MAG TPA: transposase [Ktedonobacterales bacterium]|nr:transposase [Ktedonobacterales bacterium]
MLLCTKIRLQVSEADGEALEFMQGTCRGLYDWWVLRLRDGEPCPGWAEAKATLEASKEHDPELRFVYGKLLHEVYFRLDKAMAAFFRRVKAGGGEKPGFPRVRPRHAFFTLCYPAMYVTVEGDRLYLPTGGGGKTGIPKRYPNVVARLTVPAPEHYREVAISRDARRHYYASFVAEEPDQARKWDGGILALDLGIKTLATGVNEQGRVYTIGGFKGGRWYYRQLDKIRSKRDRCQKKSRRYIRLSRAYQRVSERKRNKQRDCLHKASHLIAHRLVESTVVIGDPSQRQMVTKADKAHQEKNHFRNRAVFNDRGVYGFVRMLEYECRHAGKRLEIIEERYTTQECSRCHHRQDMPLWKRTYRCGNPECLFVLDRDVNSAIKIRERFLARLGPHTEASVRCAAS